jgi:alpha-L-rhamnosidase
MLSQGATTWWEQWNGYWSQIHACYTSLDGWFYQGLAGIQPDTKEPGFKKIIIKPYVSLDLTWVKACYNSSCGQIVSNWKKEEGMLYMDINIPTNSTATVYFPTNKACEIFSDNQPLEMDKGLQFLRRENGTLLYSVKSGDYHFTVKNIK